MINGYAALKQIVFFLYLTILFIGCILRLNIVLFLSILFLPQVIIGSLVPLLQSIFTSNYSFVNIGFMPGYANALGNLLTTASAFLFFLIRLFSYWQEHKAGKNTKF